jgi:hypothetical protein
MPWAGWSLTVAHWGLLAAALLFFSLHFVHLGADFPNHSRWMDWSKYTDEGWYGDAAIRHLQRGQWFVPGDFNPGAALPAWPVLEFLVFSVTGVSLIAARALTVGVFGGILLTAYFLVRRSRTALQPDGRAAGRWSPAPAVAVLLLAVSPFCYVFTRLAILEPLLVLLGLVGLLVASFALGDAWEHQASPLRRIAPVLGLGIILPLMVLTKTTAVFLFPSILWMLWAATGYRVKAFLMSAVPAGVIGAMVWAAYFVFFVRPRFLADYRYLFSANAYTGMTRENAFAVIADTVRDGMWMGKLIYPLALATVVLVLVWFRRSLRNPLVPSLILWAGGYAGFLAYHNNLQPRYYLVIAVAVTVLLPVAMEEMIEAAGPMRVGSSGLWATIAASAVLIAVATADALQTIDIMRAPQYTYEQAVRGVAGIVEADHGHSPLILSISGSDISLMTGLPSICDDFGTMELKDRAAAYRPGWYATWNEVEDDKMDALAPLFHLERVAAFPAFDDPDRNLLILYRLDPPQAEVPRKPHRRAVPKLLQTKTGQQPSAVQLEH